MAIPGGLLAQLLSCHSECVFLACVSCNYLLLLLFFEVVWKLSWVEELEVVAVCGRLSMILAFLRLDRKLCLGVVLRASAIIASTYLMFDGAG